MQMKPCEKGLPLSVESQSIRQITHPSPRATQSKLKKTKEIFGGYLFSLKWQNQNPKLKDKAISSLAAGGQRQTDDLYAKSTAKK